MARTTNRRNVILIFARDPGAAAATAYKGAAVEMDSTGTFAVANAQTGTDFHNVRNKLVQPQGISTGTPEGSAVYSPREILREVYVDEHQLV